MKNEDCGLILFVLFATGVAFGVVTGIGVSFRDNERNTLKLQKEALDRGYAVYESDANGEPKFTWREKQ